MDTYKVLMANGLSDGLLELLVKRGFLEKVEAFQKPEEPRKTEMPAVFAAPYGPGVGEVVVSLPPYTLVREPISGFVESVDKFLNNHVALENNIETIAKENLGVCEPRKEFEKSIRAAAKEYGHDEVIEAFYNWSIGFGNFAGRKPVAAFLKRIDENIGRSVRKPTVTNPTLNKVEKRIAYVSDNKVFFTSEYRVRLAGLLKDYGGELVLRAFEDFYQDVEEKSIPYAARDFLQRAAVMIAIIQKKKAEAEEQDRLTQYAYQKAQQSVEPVEEEEEEL